jgi:hypothetical protein
MCKSLIESGWTRFHWPLEDKTNIKLNIVKGIFVLYSFCYWEVLQQYL